MVTVEINVTKWDILGADTNGDTPPSPILNAARRAGFIDVFLGHYQLGSNVLNFGPDNGIFPFTWKDLDYVARLPKEAAIFQENYLSGNPVKPFKFRIKLKNSVAKQLKLKKSAIVAA